MRSSPSDEDWGSEYIKLQIQFSSSLLYYNYIALPVKPKNKIINKTRYLKTPLHPKQIRAKIQTTQTISGLYISKDDMRRERAYMMVGIWTSGNPLHQH